jgi:radical SAM superfamily enzyme YgiQ (UPF0313 family)
MKILLVLPACDWYRVLPGGRVPRRAMQRFSVLPLTTVAALTPPGHQLVLCDENVEALDLEQEADLVGISFMTALAPRAYEIARAFRARGIPVVAGGYHPTFMPEEAAHHFDSVVVGDAEGSWPRLVEDLERGELQPVYRNPSPPSLAGLPVPERRLTLRHAKRYATVNAVQSGRGCRHPCRYCSITAFHQQRHRTRPVDEVIAEIASLHGDFMFIDDNIIADPAYARALFERLVPLRKRWVSQCSLLIADDPRLLALARRSGCSGLFIGLESLDPQNLVAVGKGFNAARGMADRIARIRKSGIGIVAGIIVGMDHDGPEVFRRMLQFLRETRVDALQLNILTPLPGTPLFSDFEAQGRILDRDWSHYDFRHTVIRPARMSSEQLQAGADWLYRSFYRLDRIALRALSALFTLGPRMAVVAWLLNLTYRRDNHQEELRGRDPALDALPVLRRSQSLRIQMLR